VVLWRAQAATATPLVFLDIAAGYGMVYACNVPAPPSRAGLACAFDAHTGARAWQRHAVQLQPQAAGPGAMFWSTNTPEGDAEIVASGAATGSTLWSFNSRQPNISACYAGGTMIASSYGALTALDARTGRRAWASKPTSYFASVATERDTVYASGYASSGGAEPDWQLVAIHASTGAQRWRFTGITSELLGLAAGDGVVCGTQDQFHRPTTIFAVDASDGRRLWQADSNTVVQAISSGFVISWDLASLTSGRMTLHAHHASSGAPAWHRTLAANVEFLTSDSRALYAGGANDNLVAALAADTGKTQWTHRLSAPAQAATAVGNALYVIDADATVYAIQA
jgi:outer membrane protein assembly factor BamB